MMIEQNLLYTLPECFLLLMTCGVLLATTFSQRLAGASYVMTQLVVIATAFLMNHQISLPPAIVFEGHFILDTMTIGLKLFLLVLLFVVILYTRDFIEAKKGQRQGEFYSLLLFSVLGMLLLISAHSLLLLYLGLELLTLPLVALVAFDRDEPLAIEAAMKYFVFSALASGFFLYGVSFVFGVTGYLDIPTIFFALQSDVVHNPLLWIGLILMLSGVIFKLGGVPFHMWVPDVYTGASLPVTLLVSSLPKIAAFVLAYRLLIEAMPALQVFWAPLLMVVSVLSLTVGNLLALLQANIKRLFAYSAISHVGFILLGLMTGKQAGVEAALFYALVYVLTVVAGFGVLLWLSSRGEEKVLITDLKGLHRHHPWMAFLLLLVLFSMAGVPPTIGFFAKLGVLTVLIEGGAFMLSAFVVVISVIGAFYYLKIIKTMYFEEATGMPIVVSRSMSFDFVLSLNVLLLILLGVYPNGLMTLIRAFI